jgi:hypothetical protein
MNDKKELFAIVALLKLEQEMALKTKIFTSSSQNIVATSVDSVYLAPLHYCGQVCHPLYTVGSFFNNIQQFQTFADFQVRNLEYILLVSSEAPLLHQCYRLYICT